MRKTFSFAPPYRFLIIHTVLILLFIFTLSQRWFLTDYGPYDCFYLPFFIVSGLVVYFVAHFAQHASEVLFTSNQVMLAWNLVPGTICLVLGGFQWWAVESFLTGLRKRKTLKLP